MSRNSQWWLRTQDEVFGPVTQDNLLEWARLGRVQPGQEVSSDGENWTSATDVAFLDMRWCIDIGDGTPRGPFNKQAAQALLASGRLPRGSKLVEAVPPPQDAPAPVPTPEPTPEPEPTPTPVQQPAPQEHEVANVGEIEELKRQIETLQAGLKAAEARAAEAEKEVAEIHRETEDKIKRLPPTAQLAADTQAAMYTLMKEEAEELASALEAEKKEVEILRQCYRERTERLLTRRQEILRRIGSDADDMTRRALLAHPEDPRTAHMRQELDALRLLQERSASESERQIRDLSAKLRDSEGEVKRLRQQSVDATVIYRQLQDVREKLMRREKELMEERQKSEAERQQYAAAQQALVARLSALEMGMPGTTQQSREARNVRLPPWMGLKR